MGLPWGFEKTVPGMETDWVFGKEKVLGTIVNKGHANDHLCHESTYHYLFIKKYCNYKEWFLLSTQ